MDFTLGHGAYPLALWNNPQHGSSDYNDTYRAGNREVLDLVVKCEKAREGCTWKGEIRSLDKHKSTCLHVPVPCPRECDVGSVLRGDLQSHLRDYCSQRDYKCPHCLQMGRYRERVTSHLQHCPMVPTECPNEG